MSLSYNNTGNTKRMADKPYVDKIKMSCKHLKIETNKFLHFGRKVASSGMDLEEVNEGDKRAIGNWSTDVFGQTYSSKLPLAAMRVLSGGDTRRGFYRNSRTTFIDENKYGILAKQLFPWIENILLYTDLSNKPTARFFLNMLMNMRWVLLQDVAVMDDKNREHVVFKLLPVFTCDLFLEFQQEILKHIEENDKVDTDAGLIESVLPGLNNRMDEHSDELRLITKENREYRTKVTMPSIKSSVQSAVEVSISHFTGFLGTYVPPMTQLALTGAENNTLQQNIGGESGTQINDPTIDRDMTSNNIYSVPNEFDTVTTLMHHWKEVSVREHRDGPKWRKHLNGSDKKKFSRIKMIGKAIDAKIKSGSTKEIVMNDFESNYKTHNQSLSYLADKYLKICD